jgi:hypothetical protein
MLHALGYGIKAILPYTIIDGQLIVPVETQNKLRFIFSQVEEGGPVRPTEEMPFTSSHNTTGMRAPAEPPPLRPADAPARPSLQPV